MAEKISSRSLVSLEKVFKSFVNLLKEFPKSASNDFIYDESTLKKVALANESLHELSVFLTEKSTAFEEEKKTTIHESLDILGKLMDELPRDSQDQFSYEPEIHQLVEDARETIVKLGALLP